MIIPKESLEYQNRIEYLFSLKYSQYSEQKSEVFELFYSVILSQLVFKEYCRILFLNTRIVARIPSHQGSRTREPTLTCPFTDT